MNNLLVNLILILLVPMVTCHGYHWSSVMYVDWTHGTGVSTHVQVSNLGGHNEINVFISLFGENKDWHNNQKLKVEEDILLRLWCIPAQLELFCTPQIRQLSNTVYHHLFVHQ